MGPGPAVAIADHATVEWPEAKKRSPLFFVALLGIATAIGVGVFVFGGKNDAPPTPAISALPPAAPPTAVNQHGASPADAQGAPPASVGDATPPGDAHSPAADPGATPGAGFAELFAAGARKAETKGSSAAPADRFDPAATKAALAASAAQAAACKEKGGPAGKLSVVVTFEPTGKVSSATIADGPFGGTPTGVCIASAFKRATIAPFSGLPGTVSKSLSIQ